MSVRDICVIPIYDIIYSYMSFLSVKFVSVIYVCDIWMCHSYLWHMDMPFLSVTYVSFPFVTWYVRAFYSYLWHWYMSFIFFTYGCWIPDCDTRACHSHVWHGIFICVIPICDMCVIPVHDIIYSHVSFLSVIFMYILIFLGYFLRKGPISSGSFAERVLKFMWASDIHMCHSYLWHVCHSYLWHNTFTCVLPICGVHICHSYGVATISRLLKIIGLFAKEPIKQMIFCRWDL